MKIKNVLTALVFVLAVGAAVAASFKPVLNGRSRASEVPGQESDCQLRKDCTGGSNTCVATFDHDGNVGTPPLTRTMYDGTPDTPSDDDPICGDILTQP